MRCSASTVLDGEARTIYPFGQRYSSGVQQPWYIQVDAGGRIGTSDLLKQLVRLCVPVTTDQKVGGSSPSERAHRSDPCHAPIANPALALAVDSSWAGDPAGAS